jgi:enamine deaminase RidA (YjgF/YER057c/UK114 family)
VFANLGRAPAAAGAHPGQVAKITIYVVHHRPEYLPAIERARLGLFGDHKPADKVVGVERRPLRESGVIVVTGNRADALARLGVFVGDWIMEARFPGRREEGGPVVRSRFEWTLDRQFLMQRTEVPIPEAPDSLAIVAVDLETGAYTQHYYDSRGVARLYAMTLADGVWTLTRQTPDFTPLDFWQRYTGRFSADGNTISGAWERCLNGGDWEHDFALTYHRAG